MSMCLLQINQCSFPNCTLQFANQYDLIAHIEYTHIPLIEEEIKRKALATSNGTTDEKERNGSANQPLSIMSRVFRTAYRPNPIKSEPLKVSFNHYKSRAVSEKLHNQMKAQMAMRNAAPIQIPSTPSSENDTRKGPDIDLEECQPNDPEVRFRCQVLDCNKRYKNIYALKFHMKTAHSVVIRDEKRGEEGSVQQAILQNLALQQPINHMPAPPLNQRQISQNQAHIQYSASSGALASTSGTAPNAQPSLQPSSSVSNIGQIPGIPAPGPVPTNYRPHKCTQCSKRYKTQTGLQNHMGSTHNKGNMNQDSPSPQVLEQLISQARMHRQQQEQLQNQNSNVSNIVNQMSPSRQMGLPVSVAMNHQPTTQQQQHNPQLSHHLSYQKSMQQNTLPNQMRAFAVSGSQSIRFNQNTTTGQMLHMQMVAQKKMQLQQQQNQQAQMQQQQQQGAGGPVTTSLPQQQVSQPQQHLQQQPQQQQLPQQQHQLPTGMQQIQHQMQQQPQHSMQQAQSGQSMSNVAQVQAHYNMPAPRQQMNPNMNAQVHMAGQQQQQQGSHSTETVLQHVLQHGNLNLPSSSNNLQQGGQQQQVPHSQANMSQYYQK